MIKTTKNIITSPGAAGVSSGVKDQLGKSPLRSAVTITSTQAPISPLKMISQKTTAASMNRNNR
jgi:hypothetical protein